MGSIDVTKPLSTVLSSAVNKSHQHQEKNSWGCRESNPELVGERQICYLCAKHPPRRQYCFFFNPTKYWFFFTVSFPGVAEKKFFLAQGKDERHLNLKRPGRRKKNCLHRVNGESGEFFSSDFIDSSFLNRWRCSCHFCPVGMIRRNFCSALEPFWIQASNIILLFFCLKDTLAWSA